MVLLYVTSYWSCFTIIVGSIIGVYFQRMDLVLADTLYVSLYDKADIMNIAS